MEIAALLKANIKHKKGSFISVLILAFIIVTTAAASFGVRENYIGAYERAQETADLGDAGCIIAESLLTDELLRQVGNSSLVERVKVYDAIDRMGDTYINGNRDSNSWFFEEMRDGLKLVNPEYDGLETEIPPLAPGEIYLPTGLRAKLECDIGDKVSAQFAGGVHEFTIKGFVEEPGFGAMMMGWKQVFLCREDWQALREAAAPYETDTQTSFFKIVYAFKTDKEMSDAKFIRELNLETGIVSKSVGAITKDQSTNYTGLFLNIVLYVVIGFVLVLFAIVLVVIAHGIKTETEMDFVNLGILKAQGFTSGRLTRVIMLRYVLAELIGVVLGIIASIPLERILSSVFKGITGIIPDKSIALLDAALLVIGMLALSVLVVFLATRRLSKISPVRAISGGRKEIYFNSRINAPITKRGLNFTVAYRAFSSSVKRYLGILFITALLTYFAVTVNVMGAMTDSRAALEAMGAGVEDLGINYMNEEAVDHFDEFEEIVQKYTDIRVKRYTVHVYYSLNGENIITQINMYPETIPGLLKGRLPLMDNELIITEAVSDALNLKIGDKVTVEGKKLKADYIVSGIYQTMNDAGYSMAMGIEAAKRVGSRYVGYLGMCLEDASKREEIAAELREKFGDIVEVYTFDYDEEMDGDVTIIAARSFRIVIYAFAGVFALVAVMMVCSAAFAQERTDLGICKAIGFTSGRLRAQFTLRFFIISLAGAVLGAIAGSLFSEDLLNLIFGMFGLVRVYTVNTAMTYISAAAFICICVSAFAFFASRKVKRVEIRELVTE